MDKELNLNENVENLDTLVILDDKSKSTEEQTCRNHTYWYRHPRSGQEYRICWDGDGYLVTKPDGSNDAWGRGYSWRDVENGYGLGGFYRKREYHCDRC